MMKYKVIWLNEEKAIITDERYMISKDDWYYDSFVPSAGPLQYSGHMLSPTIMQAISGTTSLLSTSSKILYSNFFIDKSIPTWNDDESNERKLLKQVRDLLQYEHGYDKNSNHIVHLNQIISSPENKSNIEHLMTWLSKMDYLSDDPITILEEYSNDVKYTEIEFESTVINGELKPMIVTMLNGEQRLTVLK